MLRFLAGVLATLLLVAGSFFIWTSRAQQEDPIPPAPAAQPLLAQPIGQRPAMPPSAPEQSKEEKRFGRADKDDDGRITRAEMLEPRRKAFARLDKDGNGSLGFEEWATKTVEKFAGADADKDGALTPAEYSVTRPKPVKRKCAC